MELKEFLEQNPIIQKKLLAEKMYPGNKSANSKLGSKLAERIVGSGKQRILEKDTQDAVRAFTELRDNLNDFITEHSK